MVEVSTSILTMEKGKEAETLLALEKSKTDYFHIDVMDGNFVEKDTYHDMVEYSAYIRRISNLPMDVHIITFHLEACENKEEVMKYITLIKEKGSRVGIAIKPETPIEQVYEYLPYIHTCLVMTVEPGKGGQTLITDMIAKISELKLYTERKNIDIDIEADGGINLKTATRVKRAGANVLVAGTAILMASDYKVIIDELKEEE